MYAHGHHVFRVYFRNAVLRQYEKLLMLLRNELCSNNLYDFGLRKGLEMRCATNSRPSSATLPPSRPNGSTSMSSFRCCSGWPAGYHQLGPISRYHSKTRASSVFSKSFCMAALSSAVGPPRKSTPPFLTTLHLSDKAYGLNQLRYDLRKLRGHGLSERATATLRLPPHPEGCSGRCDRPLLF
jgi:hypothetical protein